MQDTGGHAAPGNFKKLPSLKCYFLHFGGDFTYLFGQSTRIFFKESFQFDKLIIVRCEKHCLATCKSALFSIPDFKKMLTTIN